MHQVASTQMRMQNICVEVLIWIQNSNVLLLLLLYHTQKKKDYNLSKEKRLKILCRATLLIPHILIINALVICSHFKQE
jgi:hypothetical protein